MYIRDDVIQLRNDRGVIQCLRKNKEKTQKNVIFQNVNSMTDDVSDWGRCLITSESIFTCGQPDSQTNKHARQWRKVPLILIPSKSTHLTIAFYLIQSSHKPDRRIFKLLITLRCIDSIGSMFFFLFCSLLFFMQYILSYYLSDLAIASFNGRILNLPMHQDMSMD